MKTNTPPPALSLSAWLVAARAPFLNFLRNLTPQILLASLAWLLALKLDFTRLDITNYAPMLGFYIFLALFLYSVYANTSLFLEELFPDFMPWLRAQESSLQDANMSRLRIPLSLLKAVLRERKIEAAIAIFVILILNFVFAGVIASSIATAVNFLRAARG